MDIKKIELYNGIKMPIIGLGTYTLFSNTLVNIVKTCNEIGVSMFDTAHLYQNEKDLYNAFVECGINRENVFLTSKVAGIQILGHKKFLCLDKQSTMAAFTQTCKYLHTDYLDNYLLHSTAFGEWKNVYSDVCKLYESSKIKSLGVCNTSLEDIRYLIKEAPIKPMLVQIEITPYYNQRDVIDICQDNGIVVEAHSQFANGDSLLMQNPVLVSIGNYYGKSVWQIILRWLIQQNVIIIPRSSNASHLKSNIDIFDFEISESDMLKISSLNTNYSFFKKRHFQ